MSDTKHPSDEIAFGRHSRTEFSPIEICLTALFVLLATVFSLSVTSTPAPAESLYERNSIDSLVFRAAGELLRDGRSPYSNENQLDVISLKTLNGKTPPFAIPFAYPPNSLPFFHLRALGEPAWNATVYMGISVICSLLTLAFVCLKYLATAPTRLAVMFTAAFWTPALIDINLVQTGHIVAFFAFAFLLLHDKGPILAGIILGILACKPQYAVPLGLVSLIRLNWPVLVSAASTFIVMSLSSALLYGWSMWPEFWQSATGMNTTMYFMKSWIGVASLAFPEYVEVISQMAIPVYFVAMLVLSVTLFALRKRLDLLGMCSLAILVTLVTSPNTHHYDMSLALIPALYISRELGMRIWPIVVVFLAYSLPNSVLALSKVIFLSAAQLFLLALCSALLVWMSLRKRPAPVTAAQG
jgi:hypothetical protein